MKKLLIILFLFATFISNGQNIKGFNVTAFDRLDALDAFVISADTMYNTTQLSDIDTTFVTKLWAIDSLGSLMMPFDSIAFDTTYVPRGDEKQGVLTWNAEDRTVNIPTGLGPVLQVGQELYVPILNNSGAEIPNGTIVKATGILDGYITIGLAYSSTHVELGAGLAVTTMTIPDDSVGIVTSFGKIRDFNTNIWSASPLLYIAPSAGYTNTQNGITNVKPAFPDYVVQVGAVTDIGTSGSITIEIKGDENDMFHNFWNGVFRETFDFKIVSNGTVIKGYIEPANGHPDMTMLFSDGKTMLPTTPADSIVLVAGNDTIAQDN